MRILKSLAEEQGSFLLDRPGVRGGVEMVVWDHERITQNQDCGKVARTTASLGCRASAHCFAKASRAVDRPGWVLTVWQAMMRESPQGQPRKQMAPAEIRGRRHFWIKSVR